MTALVLALNPSIDAEWRVDDVLWEEKNSVRSERRWAGGKGINVARWLKHLGGQPQLLLPLGGKTGDELSRYLSGEKIPTRTIPLRAATRVNVIITTNAGRQMRFNPPGPRLAGHEWKACLGSVEYWFAALPESSLEQPETRALKRGVPAAPACPSRSPLLILSGSLPRGVPDTAYRQLLGLAHRFGVRTLLDCEGAPLQAAVTARPFLVKPNEHELADWWRRPLRTEAEVRRAASALSDVTRGWVFVSRGAKRSVLVNTTRGFQVLARPRNVNPRNTVGAGDALLAAVANQIQRGAPPSRWLEAGLAAGTAATQCLPGKLPTRRYADQ